MSQDKLEGYVFPTNKLKPLQENKKPVVLVSCGSFSPITHMHLRLFEMCNESFNNTEFQVVGQYISPVADAYGKKGLVAGGHRVAMCNLATENTDIMVDDWETRFVAWTPTKLVLDHFENELKAALGTIPKIYLICGTDLLDSFNTPGLWAVEDMHSILGHFGLVCLQRGGASTAKVIEESSLISQYANNIRLVDQWMDDNTSSTNLRMALSRGLSIRYLTPDKVIQYIREHHLYAPVQ